MRIFQRRHLLRTQITIHAKKTPQSESVQQHQHKTLAFSFARLSLLCTGVRGRIHLEKKTIIMGIQHVKFALLHVTCTPWRCVRACHVVCGMRKTSYKSMPLALIKIYFNYIVVFTCGFSKASGQTFSTDSSQAAIRNVYMQSMFIAQEWCYLSNMLHVLFAYQEKDKFHIFWLCCRT